MPTDPKTAIQQNREAYNARVAALQADERLSPHGREEAIQEAYEEAHRRDKELRTEYGQQESAELQSLRSAALDPGYTVDRVEFRSALGIAAASGNLAELAAVATLTGDKTLAKACAAVACARPESSENLTMLRELAENDDALARYLEARRPKSPTQILAERMAMAGPRRP